MSRHFDDAQYENRQTLLANELGLTLEEIESIPLDADSDVHSDDGNSGNQVYSFYFNVPDTTPEEILDKKCWEIGERVELSLNIFDEEEND
ncbi:MULTISPECIES: hypothetical protein [Pectobacterium]|uniref:Uncharacterized protein n=1 Tax=Pectobacterium actinidiae TaxID=1507808 RepID=A0ABW8G536_9GAMM|nr:hypothetical protein [Pectobacterium fontis]